MKNLGSWARSSGQSRLFLTRQSPFAAQAACPAPGKGQGNMRGSLTLLASALRNGRVGVEIQHADVQHQLWEEVGGRDPAKICSVVWNGTRPISAGFTEATWTPQKHPTPFQYPGNHISPHVLHNHGICFPMHALPGPLLTKNTPKEWVLRHTGHPWWELLPCTERTRMVSRWTQNTSCLLTGI